jgi:flagellar assembly protein FliH
MSDAKPARGTSPHARFIPREEVQSFAAWQPGALGDSPLERRATPRPQAPTAEEQRAALKGARQSGYQDGYRDGLVALDAFKQSFAAQTTAQIGQLLRSFEQQIGGLEQQMAQALAQAATQLARQVVRSELAARPELVAAVAREALGALLLSAQHVTVQVHPDDLPLVAQGAGEELARRGARLVTSTQVARGGCRVDSDVGSVDAGIEQRWRRAASALGDEEALGGGDDDRALVLRGGDAPLTPALP